MLCDQCKANAAKVHFTTCIGDGLERVHLCEDCAKPRLGVEPRSSLDQFMGSTHNEDLANSQFGAEPSVLLEQFIRSIHSKRLARYERFARSSPYPLEAFEMIFTALTDAQTSKDGASTKHVSAFEFLVAFGAVAIQHFGKGAKSKLKSWNITRIEHIGDVVFRLIEAGVLTKRPEDSHDNFVGVFDFDVAFPEE